MVDGDTLRWQNGSGKNEERPIDWTLDIRNHRGEPGFALLLIAANTHLSVSDLLRFLSAESIGRSPTWVKHRRWLFQQPGTVNPTSPPNRDGKDTRAVEIMREHLQLSVRDLAKLLKENGITRSREWVRRRRCD